MVRHTVTACARACRYALQLLVFWCASVFASRTKAYWADSWAKYMPCNAVQSPSFRLRTRAEVASSMASPKSEHFIEVAGVTTLVMTYGAALNHRDDVKDIVLFFPGNPGLVEYYDEFLSQLFSALDGRVSVWAVSHAGHSLPLNVPYSMPADSDVVNTVAGQVQHKLAFIGQYIPRGARVFLVGHSLGAHVCVRVSAALSDGRQMALKSSSPLITIAGMYLLFPALRSLRATPAGRRMWPLLKHFTTFIVLLVTLFQLLPACFSRAVCGVYFRITAAIHDRHTQRSASHNNNNNNNNNTGPPATASTTTTAAGDLEESADHPVRDLLPLAFDVSVRRLLRAEVVRCVMRLGFDEMSSVDTLDGDELRRATQHVPTLMYWGANDHWAPTHFAAEIEHACRGSAMVRVVHCTRGIHHSFSLYERSSRVCAQDVAAWLRSLPQEGATGLTVHAVNGAQQQCCLFDECGANDALNAC